MPNTHIVLRALPVGNGKVLKSGEKVDASNFLNLAILEAGPAAYLRRLQEEEREKPKAARKARRGKRKSAPRREAASREKTRAPKERRRR
jgi:hypothetical protein